MKWTSLCRRESSGSEIQLLHFQHIDVEFVRLVVAIVFTQADDLYKNP